MRVLLISASALLLASGGCLTYRPARPAGAEHSVITARQIQEHNFQTAYDAIEALHANWFQARGPDSFARPTEVLVYLDDARLGGVLTLKDVSARIVTSIQHFDGIAAAGRWGLDHGGGVILVSTKTP